MTVPRAPFVPDFPYHMVWIATNACNTRCVHCSTDAAKRLPGELTTGEAKRLFDQFAAAGVLDVAISGGEPLTRRDIFDVIAHASALHIRTGLGTNGSTVSSATVRRLQDAGLHRLQVSIDGVEPTHDIARRWPGLYRKSASAIQLAIDNGLRAHVCFTAHRLNFTELEAVVDQCARWGVSAFNLSRFIPTGRGVRSLDLKRYEWHWVMQRFAELRSSYAGRMDFSTHLAQLILLDPGLDCMTGFAGCQAGSGQGCVGPQGAVTPCVMLPIEVGNVHADRFQDIWHSAPLLKALRDRAHLKGACARCPLQAKCGGCRAVAYAYHGDPFEEDTRCWRETHLQPSIKGIKGG